MDRPNIARIESGRHAASTGTILRICKALGVPMAALVAAPGPDADDEALAQAGVERWNDLVDGEAEP
jgi:transcriptional regulator with XRE-family HTH domain